jgi:hypothetical protein
MKSAIFASGRAGTTVAQWSRNKEITMKTRTNLQAGKRR